MSEPVLVIGSVAFDTIETPTGKVQETLGGSATYFSLAASYFHPVRLVAVVGNDFSAAHRSVFRNRPIDLEGLEEAEGKTFCWGGRYGEDPNQRETLFTHLNVFETFQPRIPAGYQSSEFVFLGNIDPSLQSSVLDQTPRHRFVGCDTMNFWIQSQGEALARTLRRVHALLINDSELRELSGNANLLAAGDSILSRGPRWLVVKRGEYGAVLLSRTGRFLVPAFLVSRVKDPTGAGDSFAGGFMGHLARNGEVSEKTLREAVVWGTVMASFCVEQFGVDRLAGLQESAIQSRYREFRRATSWDPGESP